MGYKRVSTKAQDAQLQADALAEAGCARVFEDKASGKNIDRAGLLAALDYMREGDTFVVWKLDRLGRSTKDVLTIAEDLHARGIALRILAGTLAGSYSPKGEGKFFFTMMVAFAEIERDMIVECTRAGLEAAKAQGRTSGRPKAMTEEMIAAAKARRAAGESYGAIAKALGVGQATVYRHLSE
ncbi:recombinase family protein [Streptomyces pactum]|uniref:recombinase family protein n=1 Tax=Streptomyces pactum TaxID=68249 RepID=UPI0027DB1FAE|nr:recombinase family protein [Streptomyces pactum]